MGAFTYTSLYIELTAKYKPYYFMIITTYCSYMSNLDGTKYN